MNIKDYLKNYRNYGNQDGLTTPTAMSIKRLDFSNQWLEPLGQ